MISKIQQPLPSRLQEAPILRKSTFQIPYRQFSNSFNPEKERLEIERALSKKELQNQHEINKMELQDQLYENNKVLQQQRSLNDRELQAAISSFKKETQETMRRFKGQTIIVLALLVGGLGVLKYLLNQTESPPLVARSPLEPLREEYIRWYLEEVNLPNAFRLEKQPQIFNSYAWGDTARNEVVHRLGRDLKRVSKNALLDIEDNPPATDLYEFAGKISDSHYVILMGTRLLKEKCEGEKDCVNAILNFSWRKNLNLISP
ncbi:MAG TPA: hypothetical protein PLY23_07970, partial [Alphaproteobacteria bacterium]|nr:hypothetical protein [Alphaproteobacteria bacterium]HQS93234.1 hypothetical protein [Alphaproteobacteria bacterium]